MFLKKLIIFLLCKKIGVKKYEKFRFNNQKSEIEFYWFTNTNIRKLKEDGSVENAHVSLNWLLDDECEIVLVP